MKKTEKDILDYLNKIKEETKLAATKDYIENDCLIPDDNYHAYLHGFEMAWRYICLVIENPLIDLEKMERVK